MSIQSEKNKAIRLIHANKMRDAKLIYKKLSKKVSGDAEVWNTLSAICASLGEYQDAITYCRKAIQLHPDYADAYCNLGAFLEATDQADEAIDALQQALALNPDDAEIHFNIANALESKNDLDQAIEHYQKSLAINPNDPETWVNLGSALNKQRQFEKAIVSYQKAIDLNPGNADAYNNIGTIHSILRNQDEAEKCFLQAIQLNPEFSKPHKNLSYIYANRGLLDKTMEELDKALAIEPDYPHAQSNRLFYMNYTGSNQLTLYDKHRQWGNACMQKYEVQTKWSNNTDPERPLKIGYVSHDFFTHSVAYFLEPILQNYSKKNFKIYCYANVEKPDKITERFQSITDEWRDVYTLADEKIRQLILQDEIDILIDLSGHTGNKSPTLFAMKPAPLQLTYLGYPNTTGLPTIDYRITDEWADPDNQDALHTEKLLRLKTGFLCYRPLDDAPDIGEPPAIINDHITFGSFNNLLKVNNNVIAIWSRILLENKNSRLILKCRTLDDKKARDVIIGRFLQHGIDKERLNLISWVDDTEDHLALYNKIDIALDPFPYNGTTTSCEALWMGVPIITLKGGKHASRVSYSILHQLGLDTLAADTEESYCQLAQELAANKEQLTLYRKSMRELMKKSPLCDEINFTKEIEKHYRSVWQQWCEAT